MALLSTVAASPRQAPKHSMAIAAASRVTCTVVFFAWLIFITLSVFLSLS